MNIPQDKHKCFKNWTASSSETSLWRALLKQKRCKVHGVRYTTFIGDGDSSVHPILIRQVPVWGHAIKKLECANHSCKCYRGALEKLVQDNPSYKGLTEKMRRRLVSAARCAIKMRSKESDRKNGVKLLKRLKRDLLNGPNHCFGHHTHCSSDFCSTAKNKQPPPATYDDMTDDADRDDDDVLAGKPI